MAVRQKFLDANADNSGNDYFDTTSNDLTAGLPLPSALPTDMQAGGGGVADGMAPTPPVNPNLLPPSMTTQFLSPGVTDPTSPGGPVTPPTIPTPGTPPGMPPGSTPPTFPTNPDGSPRTNGGGTTSTSTSSSARDVLESLLASGMDPQKAIDQVNNQFGLGYGKSGVYYPAGAHGPGSGAVIGIAGYGGYFAQQPDGSWQWVLSPEQNGSTPNGGGGNGGGANGSTISPGVFDALRNLLGNGQVEVGNDPFSGAITGGITDLISNHGMTPEMQSVFATLKDLISRSGRTPADDPIVQQQMESAREAESAAFTGQLNDARAELAARGLVSEPGVGQGEEAGAIHRISTGLAPTYSSAVRDIQTSADQRQNDRLISSLSTITGLSTSAASNLLGTLGAGTQRQSALADIALRQLDQNMSWQEFLANYGLNRDQITAAIASGNASALLPILALFQSLLGTTAQGHV